MDEDSGVNTKSPASSRTARRSSSRSSRKRSSSKQTRTASLSRRADTLTHKEETGKSGRNRTRRLDMQVLPQDRKFLYPEQDSYPYPASYVPSEPLTTPHTVTALLLVLAGIVYVFVYRDDQADTVSNTKTGLAVAIVIGLVFAMEYFRDTLLIRPHPALWRLSNGISFFYMLLCAFSLFQVSHT